MAVLGEMIHGFTLASIGSVEEGLALIEQAWAAADRLDHRILGMRTAHIRTYWALVLREPDTVIRWGERELSQSRLAHVPIQRRTLQGQLAWAYALAGRLSDAERLNADAGDIGVSMAYAPALELWQGDWPAAEAMLRQGTNRCREMGDRMNETVLQGWTASVSRLQGDLKGAESCLNEGLAIAVPAGLRVYEAGFRVDLAFLEIDRRRLDSARDQVDRAKALMAGQDWRGLADRLALAEVALAAEHDPSRAGPLFERVVEALRARLLPWDQAEALLLWGRFLGQAGEPTRAVERFDAALSIYDRCCAGPHWQDRVQRERSSIG